MEQTSDNTTFIGTIAGTGLSLLAMFDAQDILKTIIMATIGVVVSFVVSKVMWWVWRGKRKG